MRLSLTIPAVLGAFLLAAFPATSQDRAASETPAAPPIASLEEVPDDVLWIRLADIFSTIDRLDGLIISVRSGVVVLRGEVVAEADRATALGIARRIRGVVEVRDEIEVGRNIRARGDDIAERLSSRLERLVVAVPLLAIAATIFGGFVLLSRWVGRRPRFAERLTANPMLRQLLVQAVRAAIVLLGLVLALEILDASSLIGAVLGAAGLTGLVLGFALKETVENYVAGLLLSLRQPFAPHDHILVPGGEGHVIRLTPRATVLMTLDGNHLRIPNAVVFKGTLVNYSRNPERRFEFDIGVGGLTDLTVARHLAVKILAGTPGVLVSPQPDAWVSALGESNVVLKVLGWIDQRTHSLARVRGEAIRRVKVAFEAAEFDLPEPTYRVHLLGEEGDRRGGYRAPAHVTSEVQRPEAESDTPEPDLGRDTHIDEEVAAERARMTETDMLDPAAPRE
ncbi:MAG: mechanosensitive ion channel domain-containing protein [Rhodospirillaceae bacterium]